MIELWNKGRTRGIRGKITIGDKGNLWITINYRFNDNDDKNQAEYHRRYNVDYRN